MRCIDKYEHGAAQGGNKPGMPCGARSLRGSALAVATTTLCVSLTQRSRGARVGPTMFKWDPVGPSSRVPVGTTGTIRTNTREAPLLSLICCMVSILSWYNQLESAV